MKPLGCDPQRIKGMSEKLIYRQPLREQLRRCGQASQPSYRAACGLDFNTAPNFLINGLKREELIASNSMILHELFFDGLGDASEPGRDLAAAIARYFGSFERWRAEFVAMGKALGGGSGWVLLSYSPRRQAPQPMGGRPLPHSRRRSTHSGTRYVRAFLPHRLRR